MKKEEHRKKPAEIDIKKYLVVDKSHGEEVPVMTEDCIQISAKLLPVVFNKMKGLSKVDRVYQMAIVNAALIEYLEKKERELGIDLETLDSIKTSKSRPINGDLRKALSIKE